MEAIIVAIVGSFFGGGGLILGLLKFCEGRSKTRKAEIGLLTYVAGESLAQRVQKAEDRGWMDYEEKRYCEKIYNWYTALGGNSLITPLRDRFMALHTCPPYEHKKGEQK